MTYVFALRDSAIASIADNDLAMPSNGYLTAAGSVRLIPDAEKRCPLVVRSRSALAAGWHRVRPP
jgi:hypothetical protein